MLVLAHGYPWPDGSRSDSDLIEYARSAVARWTDFAEACHAIVAAPVFGGRDFPGYREMLGRDLDPGEFVNLLVDELGKEHIPRFTGRFSLHGHSAGAQFAARYLVTHPERLEDVVLSAPSTYPFPDPAIPWPNGMAPAGGHGPGASRAPFIPKPACWLTAASKVSVNVLVGSGDTQPRPAAPGQHGSTRIERAVAWVDSMRHHAETSHVVATIQLVLAAGLDHDEESMAVPAQRILHSRFTITGPGRGEADRES